jgi:hypothetical protein
MLLLCGQLAAQVNVVTYHNDNRRTGQNLNEVILRPANVTSTTFGKLFTYSVDGYVYAQPLYVSGITIPGLGARNVLFVATEHNTVYALDADKNTGPGGGVLWQVNLGTSAATPTLDFGERFGNYTDITPEVGLTSTPVIDLASGTIYLDTFTHESSTYVHRLHALNITNGVPLPNSGNIVSASVPGNGVGSSGGVLAFDGLQQVQRVALTLANGRLYIAYGGYADTDPFHGWVIGFNPSTLAPLSSYVFCTTPNSTTASFGPHAGEAGLWMGGDGLAINETGDLFFATGNGSFNATNGTEYGSSVIRLSTTSGLSVGDYFTPYDQANLNTNDLDVGSGGVMLLPDQTGTYPHLMVAGGKPGKIYLINRDMMTAGNNHYNNGGPDAVLQSVALGNGLLSTPAYFNGRIYWGPSGNVLTSFAVSNGSLSSQISGPRAFQYPGSSPSVSANGTVNGLIWTVQRTSPAVLIASNPTNLMTELYNTTLNSARDALTNGVKFAVPTVANGKVYVGGQYALAVFGLLGGPRDAWKWTHFNSTSSAPAGNLADPDGDGVPNIWEYAFATDPNQTTPKNKISGLVSGNTFKMSFPRNLSATDLTWAVQQTGNVRSSWTNIATWSANVGWTTNKAGVNITESAASGSVPDQFVTVAVSEPISGAPRNAFYRIVLTY